MWTPTYECNENQFVLNVKRLLEARVKFVVNRMMANHNDGRYSLGHLPESEFAKYEMIATRVSQRSNVYAKRHFWDESHRRLRFEGEILHSIRRTSRPNLSIPYFRVTYSFTVWGETYRFEFDALFQSGTALERRDLGRTADTVEATSHQVGKRRSALVYILRFQPPAEESLRIPLPPSVVVLDVQRIYRH